MNPTPNHLNVLAGDTLSVPQVAERLGVSRQAVYNWCRAGFQTPHGLLKLPHVRVGSRYRINAGDLERFLSLCTDGPVRLEEQLTAEQERLKRDHEAAKAWLAAERAATQARRHNRNQRPA